MTEEERFFAKVDKNADNGCWEWTGGINGGYGIFYMTNAHRWGTTAHRWAYEHANGPVPEGLVVATCEKNKLCVNPEHLQSMTHRGCTTRGNGLIAENARKEYCVRGHAFDEENTHITPSGVRWCRTCNRERKREERAQRGSKRHYAYEY